MLYRKKTAVYLTDYRIQSLLSIQHVHGDLCTHLGIDSRTDMKGRSVFLNYLFLRDRILFWDTLLGILGN